VFHSEADFQHALAWQIQRSNPAAQVRLEVRFDYPDGPAYLDLLVRDKGCQLAIELKYLTCSLSAEVLGEKFSLKQQGAHDVIGYDCVRDVVRIERFVAHNPGARGYVIILTNEGIYWRAPAAGRGSFARDAFRIHEGHVLEGLLCWNEKAGPGTRRGREDPHHLKGSYSLNWRSYSEFAGQKNGTFKYLLIPIGP